VLINIAGAVVRTDSLHAAREAEDGGQQQRRAEGMCIVERYKVRSRLILAPGARIDEVVKAVESLITGPLLRILAAQQVLLVEAVVDLDVVLIVGVSACAGGDPIIVDGSVGHVGLGVGVELHHVLSDRIDQISRACLQVRVWVAGARVGAHVVIRDEVGAQGARSLVGRDVASHIRIVDLSCGHRAQTGAIEGAAGCAAHFAKVAGVPLRGGGNTGLVGSSIRLAGAVVIHEKVNLFTPDGTAERAAKLLPVYRRQRNAGLVIEPVVCVGNGVADKVVDFPMKLIGAGTRDHVHDRAAGKTKLGAEVRLHDAHFVHRFRRGYIRDLRYAAIGLEVGDRRAIHQHIRGRVAAAVRGEVRTRAVDVALIVDVRRTRRQKGQLHHRTVDQRQVVDQVPVDRRCTGSIIRIQVLIVGGDNDRGCGADLHAQIGRRIRAHIHADIGLLLLREAWRLGQNPVDPGRHGAEDVTAGTIALPIEGEALLLVDQRHLRIRNHGTRRVGDHSAHGAEISLGERFGWDGEEKCAEQEERREAAATGLGA